MASAAYEVGDKVKLNVNDLPYAGEVITYDDTASPIVYKVSVTGLGQVIEAEESDISAL